MRICIAEFSTHNAVGDNIVWEVCIDETNIFAISEIDLGANGYYFQSYHEADTIWELMATIENEHGREITDELLKHIKANQSDAGSITYRLANFINHDLD